MLKALGFGTNGLYQTKDILFEIEIHSSEIFFPSCSFTFSHHYDQKQSKTNNCS